MCSNSDCNIDDDVDGSHDACNKLRYKDESPVVDIPFFTVSLFIYFKFEIKRLVSLIQILTEAVEITISIFELGVIINFGLESGDFRLALNFWDRIFSVLNLNFKAEYSIKACNHN